MKNDEVQGAQTQQRRRMGKQVGRPRSSSKQGQPVQPEGGKQSRNEQNRRAVQFKEAGRQCSRDTP